jgi:hypothetical protein
MGKHSDGTRNKNTYAAKYSMASDASTLAFMSSTTVSRWMNFRARALKV